MDIRIKTAEEFRDAHVTIEIRAADHEELVEIHRRLYTAAEVGAAQASEAELVSAPLRRRVAELEASLAQATEVGADPSGTAAALIARQIKKLEAELGVAVGTLRVREGQVALLKDELAQVRAELGASEAARVAQLDARDMDHLAETDELRLAIRKNVQSIQARDSLLNRTSRELNAERERANENRAWAERAEGRLTAFTLDQKGKLAEAERAIETLGAQLGRVSGAAHSPALQAALRTTWSDMNAKAMALAIREVREALGSPSFPAEPTSQA